MKNIDSKHASKSRRYPYPIFSSPFSIDCAIREFTVLLLVVFLISCSVAQVNAQNGPAIDPLPPFFNGITLELAPQLTEPQWQLIESISVPVVIRIVFQPDTRPEEYCSPLKRLHSLTFPGTTKRKVYVMGEFLDSDSLSRYRLNCDQVPGCTFDESEGPKFHDYRTRINRYLDVLNEFVDIWEVGNEVNGEWADEGCVKKDDKCRYKTVDGKRISVVPVHPENTATKVEFAIQQVKGRIDPVTKRSKPIALTLIHQPDCTTWDDNSMVEWTTRNLHGKLSNQPIDFLLISYYEDNCDKGQSTIDNEHKELPEQSRRNLYWNRIFDQLATLFPQVRHIGFGEVGYSDGMSTCKTKDKLLFCKKGTDKVRGSKIVLLKRYYEMLINNSSYIGGHFWWTAQEDISYPGFYSELTSHFKSLD